MKLSKKRAKRLAYFTMCVCFVAPAISSFSCKEPYPVYTEPESVLSTDLAAAVVDTIRVIRDRESGEVFLVSAPITFTLKVTNEHDDLLAGKADVNGIVSVTAFTSIPKSFSIPFLSGNLISPPIVDGEVAIPPGGEAILSASAHPILQDGSLLIDDEPGGPVYGPFLCIASAEVQIFERIQPVRSSDVEFYIIFRESYAP